MPEDFSRAETATPSEEVTPLSESPSSLSPAAPPKPVFWNGWDAWVLFGVAIAGSLFASVLCQIGYLSLKRFFHWPALTSGELSSNAYFVLLAQLFLYLVLLAFLYGLITRKYGLSFSRSLKLNRLPFQAAGRFLLLGFALALVVMMLSAAFPSTRETPLEKIFGQGNALYFFAIFGIIVAPFTEELIFRGFLYPIFENMAGQKVAVFVTALIFSGLHVPQLWGSWSAVGLIFLVGLVLSSVRAATGLLTPSWVIHLAYNSTLVLAVVFAKALAPLAHSIR